MADNTAINSQITDAVTQTNVEVLASAPASSMAALYESTASSMNLAGQNAVAHQQQINTLAGAVISKCIETILSGAK